MTFFETAGQARVFRLLLYAGALSGLCYDGLQGLGRQAPPFVRGLLLLGWWLLSGALCAFALALGGESALRLYALLGLCCGGLLYSMGLRRILLFLMRGIKRLSRRCFPKKSPSPPAP